MVYCAKCGTRNDEDASRCVNCGEPLESQEASDFKVVTTPSISGYKITKVIGIVSGLSPRTRGIGGVITGMFQSIGGGEITAFTSEIEKARVEAVERLKSKARGLGANAVIGLDLETSSILQGTVLISATGTAVVIEPE